MERHASASLWTRLIVCHTADIHLGKNRRFDDYIEQQSFLLDGVVDQLRVVLKDNPDALVFLVLAGDIFDRNQDTKRSEFVLFLTNFVDPILKLVRAHRNLRVFVIDGNHDREPSQTEPSVLSPLVTLFPNGINMAVVHPKWYDEFGVLAVPYGGYTTSQFTTLCKDFSPSFVIGHECLQRMQTDMGYSPPRDQDHYIEIENVLPEQPQLAGIFLGDIHKCQTLDSKKICWYSGSPITHDFGHRQPKGILHHFFEKKDGVWKRAESGVKLVPIEDDRIRQHLSLGKVLSVDAIPWAECYRYDSGYLDMVITPEVKEELNKKIAGFCSSPNVSYSLFKEIDTKITEDSSVKETISDTYYQKAVREWTKINLKHFAPSVQDEFLVRVDKLFEGRG